VSSLFPPLFACLQDRVCPCVVVSQFHPDVTGVFALEVELVPQIILATARHNQLFEIDPSLANEICLLVVVEDGAFELIVVGRFADGETQLLVPTMLLAWFCLLPVNTHHRGVCPPLRSVSVFLASFPSLMAQ
jgi:hypothetical protein